MILHHSPDALWLPLNHAAPTEAARSTLDLVSNEPTAIATIRRYTFDMSGPNSIYLFLSPGAEHRLVKWTFANEESTTRTERVDRAVVPQRLMYMVYFCNGNDMVDRQTIRFTIDIEVMPTFFKHCRIFLTHSL